MSRQAGDNVAAVNLAPPVLLLTPKKPNCLTMPE